MSSGIEFGESYGDPFGFMPKAYYGANIRALPVSKKQMLPSGTERNCLAGNSLLLSFIIHQSTG
tara:strand:- start:3679 stop:3870 length:192 start_codon:yes stop_codon:yes gene_type:complete